MNKNAKQDPRAVTITILILIIMWIGVSINIAFINFNRVLFWLDIVAGILFIVVALFFVHRGFTERGNHLQGMGNEMYFQMAGLSLIPLIVLGLSLGVFYNVGYSDDALVKLINLHEQKSEIEMMLDIVAFKGKRLTRSVIEEAYYEACKDPNMPCDVREPYKKVLNIYGNKDSADSIAEFLWIK